MLQRRRRFACRRAWVQSGAMFEIDPAFLAGSEPLGDLALCHARLQADARWPWIILIPKVAAARELEDLTALQRIVLMEEIIAAGAAVRALGAATGFAVEKLNVGALGNVTPQLHVHVVGRRQGDPAWPGPVWGLGVADAYAAAGLQAALATARRAMTL
jgi:diadenosine tetraphosphate (Ap4A) HIT family hydrolase